MRELVIDMVAGVMAAICGSTEPLHWRREADCALGEYLKTHDNFNISAEDTSDFSDMMIWWQDQRSNKNNDFPFAGTN